MWTLNQPQHLVCPEAVDTAKSTARQNSTSFASRVAAAGNRNTDSILFNHNYAVIQIQLALLPTMVYPALRTFCSDHSKKDRIAVVRKGPQAHEVARLNAASSLDALGLKISALAV